MTFKSVRFVLLVCILISSLIYTPATPVYALSLPAQMNKSFTPISIVPGQTSVLSVTIYNPNAYALTAAHYHDFFPAGISLANPIGLTNSCGGSVTDDSFNPLAPGGTMFRLDGGTVPPQVGATPGQCTITVNVTSVTPGNLINTIPSNELTSDGDDGGVTVHITNPDPASATLQVGTVIAPSLNKTFNIGTIWVGQASQLTINVINNDPTTTLTQTTLTDTLPVPFVLANPLGSSLLNCGGGATLTGPGGIPLAVGQPSITLNNSSILPNTTCRIRVNVTSPTQGIYTNTIPAGPAGLGSIQTQQGVTNAAPASAPINVQAVGILKTFTPGTFQAGGTSVLTITLQNPTGAAYTGVGLADSLAAIPNVTFVGGTATTSLSCGPGTATLTGAPLNLLTIANATVPAGTIIAPGTCTVTAQVTGTVAGTYTNTIPAGTMTGPITNVLPVSANVTIQARAIGVTKAFVPNNFNPGGTSVLTITLQNRFSTPYTDVQFTDTLPGGGNLTIAAAPAPVNNCGGTSFTATPGTNIIRLGNGTPGTGGTIPVGTPPDYVTNPGTCTIVLTVTSATAGVYTNNILANTITSAQGISNTAGSGTLTVNAAGPVTLTKVFQSATIAAGTSVRLRLTMTAPADTALTNFSITDNLPAGVTISNSTAPAFSAGCGAAGNRTLTNTTGTSIINLVLNTLAASASCQLDVWVTSSTPGTVTNTIHPADITDDQNRTTTANVSRNLTVTNLSMTKAFFPPTVNPNGLSSLTITLTNTNPLPLVNVSLSDFLPDTVANGVVVRPLPAVNGNATTSCTGGTVTAVAGSQTITMVNGSIPAQVLGVPGQCTITVEVQGTGVAAAHNNTLSTAGVIGTIQGTGTTMRPVANANATLTVAPISIDVVKGFNPLIVTGGASSTLSVQISNPNNSVLSGITFVDNMPAGMIIATPANLNPNTACFGAGATLVTLSASSFKFSGGTLPAAGTCTLTLSATMTVNGNLTNTIPAGAVTTFNGASSPDDASATLTNLPGASISKDFSPNPIYLGSYSSLTITIQNTGNIALSGMGLVDNLPVAPAPGLVVAGGVGVPAPVNNCGGTLSAPVGSQTIQLTGGSLAGSASCTLVISVTSTAAGSYLNTIPASTLTSTEGATNKQPASDTLVVLPLASLGDFVWNDLNANGIQDAGEVGIPGVTVNLLDAAGTTTLATTTTDSSGLYSFTNLTPGTYNVQFVKPGGYTFSPADQGANDAIDSDANTSTGVTTSSYTLASGDNNTTIDAGMYQPASLGDFVWNDLNGNGIQDAGEPGIPGVTVNLLNSGGTIINTTTTNASGLYSFTNLTPGTYSVQFVKPGGYTFSPADQGANDATDSDADTTTGITTGTYTLISGENNTTVDAGMHQLASIGDFVWNDLNANGIQDAGEPGIPGVTVHLLDSGGATIATTTTDASGLYSFTNLTPGTYSVQFVKPGGYTFSPANQGANDATDSDADTTTGVTTSSYTLVSGENNTTVDAGMYQPASIGDFVWNDLNANGIQDAGEAGIPGVTVNLLNSVGTVIDTTTTNASGLYSFTNLTPGTYSVEFVKPGGYTISPADQGANDAIDSDANTSTGRTGPYTLASGENNTTVDAGMNQPASIGDFVWNDLNSNGIQDAGEAGIPNVTVHLLDSGGATVATTTTDSNGKYSFTNLSPGTYSVQFVNPGGYEFSPADQGANDAIDSDANTSTGITTSSYTLVSGENNTTVDAGLHQLASIGDFVWNDLNANGIQDAGEPGIPNVTVHLLDSGGATIATTTTDSNGKYSFTNLTPGTYSVQFVNPGGYTFSPANQGADDTVDSDANTATGVTTSSYTLTAGENNTTVDAGMYQLAALGDFVWNDVNANGIQNAGEAGIPNVTVHLLDSGGAIIATTTTDANGLYHFTNLTPGTYSVQFVKPGGYTFSPANQGANDAVDSDADTTTGITTGSYTLTSGENNITVDAGLYQAAALGDFVWDDVNANGIQDAGEVGIPGVTVNLLDSTGTTTLATTTTDANGLYHFTNLAPGTYRVGFVNPGGYSFSPADQGANDATDSDANTTTGVTTSSYTLAAGDNNITIDAGVYKPAAGLFDPPTGQKVLNAVHLPELEWRMVWINNTNVAAINVQITDPIPTNTTYVLNSLTCVANNASVTLSCVYDPILNQITWHGHIAADFGVSDPTKAVNSVIITFRVTVPDTLNQVNNQGSSLTDTNGDGRFTDETTQASVAVSNIASWSRNPGSSEDLKSLKVLTLPKTGFAPDVVTVLPPQPATSAYSDEGNIWLEIPRLGLKMPIVGVPFSKGTWDVTWITNQAGWLQGTAFPTHAGNSVLTGHVYKADGTAGPFVNLHNLQYGDIVIVHLDGQSYVYQVREDKIVAPDDTSTITHETYPWLTLITCKDYDAATNTYAHRVAVRAVLISIGNDTPTKSTGGKR